MSRIRPTVLALLLCVGACPAPGRADEPDPAPAPPSVDALVDAILLGSREDVKRAAGWLRAVPSEHVEEVLVRLRRAALPGRVTSAPGRVEGHVTGVERLVERAVVALRRREFDAAEAFRALVADARPLEAPLDGAGGYAITDVPLGRYTITLSAGPVTYVLGDVSITADTPQRRDLVLSPTEVRVRVASQVGGGTTPVEVVAARREPGAGTCTIRVGVGDVVGVAGLAPGRWDFTPSVHLVVGAAVTTDVVEGRPSDVEVRLPPFGWIDARARASRVAGARPTLRVGRADGRSHVFREADDDGIARFAVPPGRYLVAVEPRGAAIEVEVHAGARVPVDVPAP